jgi:hypothetical protein
LVDLHIPITFALQICTQRKLQLTASQLSSTKQPDQVDGITTVGFDPVTTSPRDHGGGNHRAAYVFGNKVPVDLVSTGPGFVYEAKLDISTFHLFD